MAYSPPPSSDHSHYLNLTDAVGLGYGAYQTLRRYIADGRLPAVKIGGRVKVLRSDLDALAITKNPSFLEDAKGAVERIVSSAPPLTDEQVRRLSSLLCGGSR